MLKLIYLKIKREITSFVNNTKASDDKNTGSAMAMIFAVVIGFLLLTTVYGFMNSEFLPEVFQKLKDALNYSG